MTDNEIIKALECCSANDIWCGDCPYENLCTNTDITKLALDLINRQKGEIEALIAGQETMSKYIEEQKAEIERLERHIEMYHEVRAEAVKEFAERLKEKAVDVGICDAQGNGYGGATVILIGDIDNLVKEMAGESE